VVGLVLLFVFTEEAFQVSPSQPLSCQDDDDGDDDGDGGVLLFVFTEEAFQVGPCQPSGIVYAYELIISRTVSPLPPSHPAPSDLSLPSVLCATPPLYPSLSLSGSITLLLYLCVPIACAESSLL
jgi:hypothetical protein